MKFFILMALMLSFQANARNNSLDAELHIARAKVIRHSFLKDDFCYDRMALQKVEEFQLELGQAKTIIEKGGLLSDKELVESFNYLVLKTLFESQVANHLINDRHYLLNGVEAANFMVVEHLENPIEVKKRLGVALYSLRKELDKQSEKSLDLLAELKPDYVKIIRKKYAGELDLSDLRHPDDEPEDYEIPIPISIQEK